jgi:argininosuccinate synthase
VERIILAYSGSFATSVAIPWLAEKYKAAVVTVTIDLGQGHDLDGIRARALGIGALRAHVLDRREAFARDFVVPALQAEAIYEGEYPLATALGRPLIARHLVEIAHIEGATRIAHGCTGKDNDHVRLELATRALDPSITLLTPILDWGLSRLEIADYARRHDIPLPATAESPYSIDRNLWGRSIAGGVLSDPSQEPPEDIFLITRPPAEAPDTAAYVEIEFVKGVPVAVNGVAMPLVELIQSLETIGGTHGVGRVDMVENVRAGIKSREVYEAPAALVLHAAHTDLQTCVTPRDLQRLASDLGVRYADLVYNGLWYGRTREAIDALVAKVQENVTGKIRLKLFKGDYRVVGRSSPLALDDRAVPSDPDVTPIDLPVSDSGVKTGESPERDN